MSFYQVGITLNDKIKRLQRSWFLVHSFSANSLSSQGLCVNIEKGHMISASVVKFGTVT
jgi:hypothetical protein